MRGVTLTFAVLSTMMLGGCDMLPDSVKALVSRPATATSGAYKNGAFKGQLKVLFVEPKGPEDRNVQLLEPFGYRDSRGVDWDVPKGFLSDGASIPWSLWGFIGGPFDGPYRDAAVIHDYFCDMKSRTWEDVHAMFLEAALRRGVPESTAQTMYAGILYGGPRWDTPKLLQKAQILPTPSGPRPPTDPGITKRSATMTEKQQFEELRRWIETNNPTPDAIQRKVEEMRRSEGKATR